MTYAVKVCSWENQYILVSGLFITSEYACHNSFHSSTCLHLHKMHTFTSKLWLYIVCRWMVATLVDFYVNVIAISVMPLFSWLQFLSSHFFYYVFNKNLWCLPSYEEMLARRAFFYHPWEVTRDIVKLLLGELAKYIKYFGMSNVFKWLNWLAGSQTRRLIMTRHWLSWLILGLST